MSDIINIRVTEIDEVIRATVSDTDEIIKLKVEETTEIINATVQEARDGEQGIQGETGPEGRHIESASFVGDDIVFVNDDASTVILADAKTELKGEQGVKGDTGAKGDAGYTPIKGIDYFDGAKGDTGATGEAGYTPIKGVDYFDGINGVDGEDGYTPIKGVDYFDGAKGDTGAKGDKGDPGESGKGITVTDTITFENESNYEEKVISNAAISPTSNINVQFVGSEDIAIQGIICGVVSQGEGGCTIFAGTPHGATGTYNLIIQII